MLSRPTASSVVIDLTSSPEESAEEGSEEPAAHSLIPSSSVTPPESETYEEGSDDEVEAAERWKGVQEDARAPSPPVKRMRIPAYPQPCEAPVAAAQPCEAPAAAAQPCEAPAPAAQPLHPASRPQPPEWEDGAAAEAAGLIMLLVSFLRTHSHAREADSVEATVRRSDLRRVLA